MSYVSYVFVQDHLDPKEYSLAKYKKNKRHKKDIIRQNGKTGRKKLRNLNILKDFMLQQILKMGKKQVENLIMISLPVMKNVKIELGNALMCVAVAGL